MANRHLKLFLGIVLAIGIAGLAFVFTWFFVFALGYLLSDFNQIAFFLIYAIVLMVSGYLVYYATKQIVLSFISIATYVCFSVFVLFDPAGTNHVSRWDYVLNEGFYGLPIIILIAALVGFFLWIKRDKLEQRWSRT